MNVNIQIKQAIEDYFIAIGIPKSKSKLLSNQLTNIPKSYFEEDNDWWNHTSIDNVFGNEAIVFSSRISVPKIQQFVLDTGIIPEKIPLDKFNTFGTEAQELEDYMFNFIWYTPADDKPIITNTPIIVLKEFSGIYRVLDGNHRTTVAQQNKDKFIEAYTITEDDLFNNHLFSSDYNERVRKCLQLYIAEAKKLGY
ncbi:hypothetical protein [Lactococcus lactis]